MSPKTHISYLLLLGLVLYNAAPLTHCATIHSRIENEDRLDDIMHPDMPVDAALRNLMMRTNSAELTNDYWLQQGKELIRKRALTSPNTKVAKNIILFVGDGMGITTFTAARNLLGGEEKQLAFEQFPHTGLAKTYSVNSMVPDSACTATAFLCGIKANHGTIGVNGRVANGDCAAGRDTSNHVSSIAKWALDAGKAAGLVTTTRVTHASPAGVYAHTADRDWENDAKLAKACGARAGLQDIALQLVHGDVGKQLKVVLGGGKREFIDASLDAKGRRADGRNLVEEYQEQSPRNAYVENRDELLSVNVNDSERLLGLFTKGHMDYHLEAGKKQPTLEDMTRRAIEMLQTERQGYFLFVEGGRIDTAHHDTAARLALDETVEFSKAVDAARAMTSEEDTLIVVTADHSHSFSVAGYQARHSDIYGVAPVLADDDKAYMALNYANGPSFDSYYNTEKHSRRNPEKAYSQSPDQGFPATAPLASETHGGEDVAVFASGPWAQLFSGVYEQNAIPHFMGYAACVGSGRKAC